MPNITIILSSPRSGSSWLSRALRCISQVRVFTHNTYTTQMLYMLYPLRTINPWAVDSAARRTALDRLLDPIRKQLVSRNFSSQTNNCPAILISPTLSSFVPLLENAFPTAKYVHYERDALDTIASMKTFLKKNGEDGFLARYKQHRWSGRLSACRATAIHLVQSMRWRQLKSRGYLGARPEGFQEAAGLPLMEFLSWYYTMNQRAIREAVSHLPEHRKLSISYEAMALNYQDEMSRLLKFVGIDIRPGEVPQPHDGVKSAGIGRHTTVCNQTEIGTVRNYLGCHETTKC